jgi:hypothetical protein
MSGTWLYREYVSWTLLVCAVLIFFGAEAIVIVAWHGLPKAHPFSGIVYLLEFLFINTVPILSGIKGYYAVRRLGPTLDAGREEGTLIWLSRQFLATAVFAYVAIIMEVVLLTNADT